MKWPEYSLDELGFVSRGRSRHRPRDAAHLYGGPYPFVQTGDVKHSDLYIRSYSQTYSEAGLSQSRLWPVGTLCITIAANIADTSILGIEACFPDSVIGFIPEERKADARFIKYLFDATLQSRYKTFTQGAAQDNLSQAKLLSIKLPVPDILTQTRIADILSAYDDLIENNKRRMQLLEEAARQLYREWFVRLRFPGHEHTKITNGLPEGWERKPLGELAEIKGGKQIDNEKIFPEGPYPVFGGNGIQGFTEESTHKSFLIVFGRVGANCGSVHWSYEGAWVNNNASSIIPHDSDELMLHHLLAFDFTHLRKGAAQPFIPNGILATIEFLVPNRTISSAFSELVLPLRRQRDLIQKQNQKLRAARDLLLPKLINGEIAV